MKLIPLYDKVVVRRDAAEEKSIGGILIPNAEKASKPEKGVVVAVGCGFRAIDGKLYPVAVKPGDSVYFSKYAGQEISVQGEKFLVINEAEIQAILEYDPVTGVVL